MPSKTLDLAINPQIWSHWPVCRHLIYSGLKTGDNPQTHKISLQVYGLSSVISSEQTK